MSKLPKHRCGETWDAFRARFMDDPAAKQAFPDHKAREAAFVEAWQTRYAAAKPSKSTK